MQLTPFLPMPTPARPPVARRYLSGAKLDEQMRVDIAELFTGRGFVLTTDLIRIGWSRAQIHEFQRRETP